MSRPPEGPRRRDLALSEECSTDVLNRGFCGRLATIGPEGWPYAVPLLYILEEKTVFVHLGSISGRLSANLAHDNRVCFVVDEPGEVYGYGRFECDSALAYTSVMVFGRAEVVPGRKEKSRFCDQLMRKYGNAVKGRPQGFYPRLDAISVYAICIEQLSGKEIVLPAASARWPALDRTLSPHVQMPAKTNLSS